MSDTILPDTDHWPEAARNLPESARQQYGLVDTMQHKTPSDVVRYLTNASDDGAPAGDKNWIVTASGIDDLLNKMASVYQQLGGAPNVQVYTASGDHRDDLGGKINALRQALNLPAGDVVEIATRSATGNSASKVKARVGMPITITDRCEADGNISLFPKDAGFISHIGEGKITFNVPRLDRDVTFLPKSKKDFRLGDATTVLGDRDTINSNKPEYAAEVVLYQFSSLHSLEQVYAVLSKSDGKTIGFYPAELSGDALVNAIVGDMNAARNSGSFSLANRYFPATPKYEEIKQRIIDANREIEQGLGRQTQVETSQNTENQPESSRDAQNRQRPAFRTAGNLLRSIPQPPPPGPADRGSGMQNPDTEQIAILQNAVHSLEQELDIERRNVAYLNRTVDRLTSENVRLRAEGTAPTDRDREGSAASTLTNLSDTDLARLGRQLNMSASDRQEPESSQQRPVKPLQPSLKRRGVEGAQKHSYGQGQEPPQKKKKPLIGARELQELQQDVAPNTARDQRHARSARGR